MAPVEDPDPDRECQVEQWLVGGAVELLHGDAPEDQVRQAAGGSLRRRDRPLGPIDAEHTTGRADPRSDLARGGTRPATDLQHTQPRPQRQGVDDGAQPCGEVTHDKPDTGPVDSQPFFRLPRRDRGYAGPAEARPLSPTTANKLRQRVIPPRTNRFCIAKGSLDEELLSVTGFGSAVPDDPLHKENEVSGFKHRRITGPALALVLGGAAAGVLGAAPANAMPNTVCPAPGASSAVMDSGAGASCSATSVGGAAAAAFGLGGEADADAGPTSLSLAIAQNGGSATSRSTFLSGPAAIALGPGATVTTTGVRPGLAIGIAGAGADVELTGTTGPTCRGGLAFAGDFQTLQGCLSTQ